MKHLLNTLYVLTPDAYVSLDNENVVIEVKSEERGRFPLSTLEAIACFTYAGASPSLMGACAARGINLSFFSPFGKFLARSVGETQGNVLLRKEQYRISNDDSSCLAIARNMIIGKLYNARSVMNRLLRDHPLQVNVPLVTAVTIELKDQIQAAREASSIETLRAFEGTSARLYFSAFDQLVISQRHYFPFTGRVRRPATDRLNALLSFAYVLLANDCAAALSGAGLDPYVGFMHQDRPGRKSLSLDLMEEFRPVLGDRFCITLINNRVIDEKDFLILDGGEVRLKDEARKKFLSAWQAKKQEIINHPFLKEKIQWGLLPHVQAMLLARYLRGDEDGYPPFLWS